MNIDFPIPELGENIHSGDVVNVLVQEGQQVRPDQGVLELETDKAVVEIPCPHAGTVTKVHVKKGDTVKVGQTVLSLDVPDGAESPPKNKPAAAAAPPAPRGPAAEPRVSPPETPALAPEDAPPAPGVRESPAADGSAPAAPLPAGPAVRRMARELGVDLAHVPGSGARGRITPEDVRAAATAGTAGASPMPPAAGVLPPGEPGQDAWGPVRREKISQIRRTIAAHMTHSASTIPHLTNFDDADITDLENLRGGVPEGYLGAGVKLTVMPFVIKALARALRQHPVLNASLDDKNQQIVYKQYVHLGVAVDTPRGLVVPVIRNVDRMTLAEIARALRSLAERARAVQFGIEELRGGTFTLSNLGAVGGTYSTPIINHPEVAILLTGRSRWMPVVRGGRIEPRLLLPLSLSYDHRLVDGAAAARFLNQVIDYLQAPAKLLLG
jgi:pyruvate dehydrogenase complex dihydrolipoamide acetyltransferase long form